MSKAFDSGVAMVCAQRKIEFRDAIRMFEKQATLADSRVMNKALLKIGAAIMRAGGYEEEAKMYELMRGQQCLTKFARAVYIEPVLEVLGDESYREAEAFEKGAKFDLAGLLSKSTALAPEALQVAALVSAGMGAGAGALWWALNRDVEAQDLEVQAKEEQASYYRRLAQEIQRKAKRKAQEVVKAPTLVNKPTENLLPTNDSLYA